MIKSIMEKLRVRKAYDLVSLPNIQFSPEEADRFITYIVEAGVLKNFARIERMNRPQKDIPAIGFGTGRFLYPAGQFNESKYKKEFASTKIRLETQHLRGAFPIFDSDLEDLPENMSEAAYKDALIKLIAQKIDQEIEAAFWIGDTVGLNGFAADDIRSLFDGWRYRIVNSQIAGQAYYNLVAGGSHVINACEGGLSGSDFAIAGKIAERLGTPPYDWEFKYHQMLKEMPARYKAGLADFRFLNSDLVTQDYIGALASRGTTLGDAVITGTIKPAFGAVQIVDVPLMPTDLGDPTATPDTDGVLGAGNYTDVLLTLKDNLIVGFQRDIRIESQREAADEATYFFYSIRVALAIENPNAIVLLRCLEHAC